MFNKLNIRNFKLFEDVSIELGDRVVFIGPNNTGKTSALQAIALWDVGVKRWIEKRGKNSPKRRPGVTINRRDITALPIPAANLLWRNLHVREGYRKGNRTFTKNVLIQIEIEGINNGKLWKFAMEYDYANEESLYCRPLRYHDGTLMEIPENMGPINIAYLPPMSGLAAQEDRLDKGAINVRLGEGRTAEVLRNLCWQVFNEDNKKWKDIVEKINDLFGTKLMDPLYIKERGQIIMNYKTRNNVVLDLSACGRGQQQTLLILAYMASNPGAVLLMDEPDAHLEILRQRQIYNIISEQADKFGNQVIAASHSEVILNEAADKDVLIAFIGRPHRINDKGSQVLKSLKEFGFEHYYQAETNGWVLYLEGSTDLSILQAFAKRIKHPSENYLQRPFVYYVSNQPNKVKEHFYALKEAKQNLVGIAIFDKLDHDLPQESDLTMLSWKKRELENYLCFKDTLLAYAKDEARKIGMGEISVHEFHKKMEDAIQEIEDALRTLNKPSPWSDEIKASDEFLTPVFAKFYEKVGSPNRMLKSNFHVLVPFVPTEKIDKEINEKLDAILKVAKKVNSMRPES